MTTNHRQRRPRITLLNEGTYPVLKGGVSTWCDQIVGQLGEFDFQLVTVVGQQKASVWTLPPNVRGFVPVAMWDPPIRRRGLSLQAARTQRRRVSDALADLWCAILPPADVLHVASNGTAALLALVQHWRDGTPIVMTEHGVYLRERYLAVSAAQWAWPVRYAFMAFTRVICQLAYAEASAITPVSGFNARWERRLGADPRRIEVIPNGVDPALFPRVVGEPDVPTVSFVGRIDPLKDLATLIDAFALVHAQLPAARLRLFGPTPLGNEEYRAGLEAQIAALGLDAVATFEGPVASARPAIEAGHVVALSSISEGLPFTVIEAMMSGRATVSTDVGGVSECTGTDGIAGLVVPARDPGAMASALVGLLTDDARRLAMARAARARALERFTLGDVTGRYRDVYLAQVSAGSPRHASTEARPPSRSYRARHLTGPHRSSAGPQLSNTSPQRDNTRQHPDNTRPQRDDTGQHADPTGHPDNTDLHGSTPRELALVGGVR